MHPGAWEEGEVAIFEGVEKAREICEHFMLLRKSELEAKEAASPHSNKHDHSVNHRIHEDKMRESIHPATLTVPLVLAALPVGCKLFPSEPIIDRKSVFVGHACTIQYPSDVSQVVEFLLSDKKVAKAAHPAMLAFRCRGNGDIVHQDNNDDVRPSYTELREMFILLCARGRRQQDHGLHICFRFW